MRMGGDDERELDAQDLPDSGAKRHDADGKATTKTRWISLFNFSSPQHAPVLVVGFLLSAAAGITGPALAIFFGQIFEAFSAFGATGGATDGAEELMRKISRDAGALCVVGLTIWFLKGGYFGLWMVFGELQAKDARDQLFQNLLRKDLEWYEMRTNGIGALLPRLQSQIRELQIGTSQPLGFSIQYIVQAIASLGLAFYTSWNLTLVILAGVPVAAVVMSVISSKMQPNILRQELKLSLASKLAGSALAAIETVKCFNGQASELGQYRAVVVEAARFYMKQAQANALQIGFVRFVTTAMFVQGFWYGSHLVTTGKTSSGDVLTTFWACLMATKAIEDILPHMLVLEKGRAAAAAMKMILEQMRCGHNKVDCRHGLSAPEFCEGDIEVKDVRSKQFPGPDSPRLTWWLQVSFAYPSRPDCLVLHESSFFFPAGETTFVVGRSGSGKSTLGNLLMRFYEPTSGSLFIDGTSIAELDVNWLRNNVTLVQQQSILFNESIFTNIAFGRRDHQTVTRSQVQVCVNLAVLQSTIEAIPDRLDTQVGSDGSALSGGQRQRVAVARARLRDTPILILDESTSALDLVSRRAVMKNILDWRRGKTTIIITHDLAQIGDDDFVYVLDDGRVVGDGYRRTLKSLQTQAPGSPASTVSDSFRLLHCTSPPPVRRRGSAQQEARYSNIDFDTRRSIMRQDSMEMRLNGIPGSSANLHAKTTTTAGDPSRLSVAYRRMSAGKLWSAFPRQSTVLPLEITTTTTSPHTPTYGYAEERRLHPATPTTALNAHLALSHAGRPMSMHQALTMKTIYGESLSPRFGSSFSDSSPVHGSRSASIATSAASPDTPSGFKQQQEGQGRAVAQRVASISSILKTVWPNLPLMRRVQLILGLLSALVHAAGPPTFSFVFSELLATFFIKEDQAKKALIYSMAILGIAIVDALADGWMHYLLEGCGRTWVDAIRLRAFERILDQPKSWFEDADNNNDDDADTDAASLSHSLDRNAEEMRNLVGRFTPFVVVVAAMMSIATVWSLVVCWKVTVVGLAAAPCLYVVTKGFEVVSSRMERLTNDAGEAAGSIFIETFIDIRTVRALTLESYFHKKFNQATSAALVTGIKRACYCGFFFGASDSTINFVTALVFWYGARVVQEGSFSVQSVLTVFSMLLFSTANANAVIAYIPQISASADTATRLLRLSDLPLHQSHEHGGTVRLDASDPSVLSGPLTFTNLTFNYPSRGTSAPALDGLNLTIPAGSCTALVGSSGSGKSTIASLLLGIYPTTTTTTTTTATTTATGETPSLILSGQPISSLHIPTLRDCISTVAQTPILFPTTVRANIGYGIPLNSPLTTTANIHAAARRAGIHDFILSLPHGYDTLLGDGGLGVSGGQAQRIAIARALARRPRILILDEATSALDAAAVDLVRETIVDLVHHPDHHHQRRRQLPESSDGDGGSDATVAPPPPMTVLIITHAREMMACADRVVVLDRGRVVEQGRYADLMARTGSSSGGGGGGSGGGALWTMLSNPDAGSDPDLDIRL